MHVYVAALNREAAPQGPAALMCRLRQTLLRMTLSLRRRWQPAWQTAKEAQDHPPRLGSKKQRIWRPPVLQLSIQAQSLLPGQASPPLTYSPLLQHLEPGCKPPDKQHPAVFAPSWLSRCAR